MLQEPGARDHFRSLIELAPDVSHEAQLDVDYREAERVVADVRRGDEVGNLDLVFDRSVVGYRVVVQDRGAILEHDDELITHRLHVVPVATDHVHVLVVLGFDGSVLQDRDELLVDPFLLHPLLSPHAFGRLVELVLVVLAVVVARGEEVEGGEVAGDLLIGLQRQVELGGGPVLTVLTEVNRVAELVGVLLETGRDRAHVGGIDGHGFPGGDRDGVFAVTRDVDLAGLHLAQHRDGVGEGGGSGLGGPGVAGVDGTGVVGGVAGIATGAAAQEGGQEKGKHERSVGGPLDTVFPRRFRDFRWGWCGLFGAFEEHLTRRLYQKKVIFAR